MTNLGKLLLAGSLVSMIAAAQARMPPIPAEKMTEQQKKTAAAIASGPRGTLRGPWVPLLRSPELMNRLQVVGEYLRFNNPALSQKLIEMATIITARQVTQQYEWDVHAPLAVQAGLKPEIVAAIQRGEKPAGMDEGEAIVWEFESEMLHPETLTDATYDLTVKKFGEQGLIDLTVLHGYYITIAGVLEVGRVPLLPGDKPQLAPLKK